jgi:hypothetical protein
MESLIVLVKAWILALDLLAPPLLRVKYYKPTLYRWWGKISWSVGPWKV